jgi:hypothetical protein
MESENNQKPEVFYKDDFCRAVTGYTPSELHDTVEKEFVAPVDEKINLSVGRDMPRDMGEEIADHYMIFMSAQFRIPLVDQPTEKLHSAFSKFRAWERQIHPRNDCPQHRDYWEPTYDRIERAHTQGDENGIKEGIIELVDKILHD